MKKLFFVQWKELDESNHLQFETDDLLKVFKRLEREFELPIEEIFLHESGIIQLNFEYLTTYISTDMEKLIDCEEL